jgi:diaminopimelate decarboxylase
VVSGGELFTAIQSAFPAERIYVHGSNKSEEELALALEHRVGRIVVDNFEEIDRLSRLAMDHQTRQSVLLRVAPSVEAHTHEHIKTGALDTKFGVSIETGAAADAVRRLQHAANLDLVGLHAHIGSQIFEAEPYRETIQRIFDFARSAGAPVRELSPGGGFGVRYATADSVRSPESAVETIAGAVRDAAGGSALPMLTIEPGRSIVARAATAVYRVGSVKDIRGVRTYVAVDGGMADNIRPTAYGARYTPVLANRVLEEGDCVVTIAGKYCESGDVLIRDARLPMPRVDDLVAVPVSGAYQLSMASNYNASPRPAVVVVADGKARLVRRRETYADLLAADIY